MSMSLDLVTNSQLSEDMLIAIKPGLAVEQPAQFRARVDVDFSLAIHNRTGKYFIGRALLDMTELPLGETYYWRYAADAPPSGLAGRIIGRLQHLHVVGRTRGGVLGWLPGRKSKRPLVHLDPFTVPTTVLTRRDAVLCHDLGPITHPAFFPPDVVAVYERVYDEIARVGPHLVFVSEAVRTEFAQRFPDAQPASNRVIHPPIRADVTTGDMEPVAGIETPFLLTVGSIGERKNQARAIAAYAHSGLAARGVHYVICGGPEPGYEAVREAVARTPGVVLLPYVSDAQLRWLYGKATGFVLMSLLEGFGMPVAEAIARRLVPLVSRGGVLHEVAGSGALQADPHDEAEIGQAMIALADMTAEERKRRLELLDDSIARFGMAHFKKGWRDAIFDMVTIF